MSVFVIGMELSYAEIVKLQYDVLNPPNTTQKPIMHAEMKKLAEYQDYANEELNAIRYSMRNMSMLMNGLGKLNVAQHKHNQRLETKMYNMSLIMDAKLTTLYDKLDNRVFSHDVTVAILVSQNNETAAMLVSQTNPVGAELFSYANAFFCFNKFE